MVLHDHVRAHSNDQEDEGNRREEGSGLCYLQLSTNRPIEDQRRHTADERDGADGTASPRQSIERCHRWEAVGLIDPATVCRTLRISCEAVPPFISTAGAQGGTL
jgi:hypothetical protein